MRHPCPPPPQDRKSQREPCHPESCGATASGAPALSSLWFSGAGLPPGLGQHSLSPSTPILQFGGSCQKVLLGKGPGSSSHHHVHPQSLTKQLANAHCVDKWADGGTGRWRIPLHGRGAVVKDALAVYSSAALFHYIPSSRPSPQHSRKCYLCKSPTYACPLGSASLGESKRWGMMPETEVSRRLGSGYSEQNGRRGEMQLGSWKNPQENRRGCRGSAGRGL